MPKHEMPAKHYGRKDIRMPKKPSLGEIARKNPRGKRMAQRMAMGKR